MGAQYSLDAEAEAFTRSPESGAWSDTPGRHDEPPEQAAAPAQTPSTSHPPRQNDRPR